MAIVGRILMVLVSLPLLVAGSYGLLASYMPDAGATAAVQDLLAGVVSALGSRAGSVPELEEWLVRPALRFSLAPAGLVLLLAGLVPRRDGRRPAEGRRSERRGRSEKPVEDEVGSGQPVRLGAAEKRMLKKVEKQAQALARKGELVEAAELLFDVQHLDKAADYFVQAEQYVRAAEIRHDQNRFVESAELYLQAGRHESAGAIFAQVEEFERAAECYESIDHMSVAAEMYEKGGNMRKAARCYKAAEFLRHAASAYVKCKDWIAAAECLDQVHREESLRNKGDAKVHQELSKLVLQAAKLYRRAGEPEKALDLLERGGCHAEAAELALTLQQFAKASELFQDAGQPERAAEALRSLGEEEEAARILANLHRDRGDSKEAAAYFEQAGDFLAAGDLYRSLESYAEAGGCFERQRDYLAAAEMYSLADDRDRAAVCYERAERFREAAECYAHLGKREKEAELLDRAGDFLASGQCYHREGLDDEAITVLQKVEPGSEGFSEASALLGDVFQARGQLSLAIKKLRQAIGERDLDRDTLPIYYSLAAACEANDELADAVDLFEKVLAFDYHYKDVEQRLVAARERRGTATPSDATPPDGSGSAAGPGDQPGRYQIVGELGRGGMGIVYKAKDTALDRLVAFKVLPDSLQENPQALRNFLREAQAAAKLNHPGIVTVYDTGAQDGRYYIAMEYVDGTTLKEILRRRGAIAPAGILHVLVQMCEALAYAHDKKVVHRDIKTANVMWTRDKKAKLMDFGLAKVIEEVRNHTTVVSGTPYYMSPEQTLGRNVDYRTDIYSLGVTLFELAAGTVPFKEGNIPYHHVHTPPPDVRELQPELPASLATVINRCLLKDPGERYQSAREILELVRNSLTQTQASR